MPFFYNLGESATRRVHTATGPRDPGASQAAAAHGTRWRMAMAAVRGSSDTPAPSPGSGAHGRRRTRARSPGLRVDRSTSSPSVAPRPRHGRARRSIKAQPLTRRLDDTASTVLGTRVRGARSHRRAPAARRGPTGWSHQLTRCPQCALASIRHGCSPCQCGIFGCRALTSSWRRASPPSPPLFAPCQALGRP